MVFIVLEYSCSCKLFTCSIPDINLNFLVYVCSYSSVPFLTASNPNTHNSSNPNSDASTEPGNTKADWHSQLGGAQRPWGAWAVCQDLQTKTNQTWIHSGRMNLPLTGFLPWPGSNICIPCPKRLLRSSIFLRLVFNFGL